MTETEYLTTANIDAVRGDGYLQHIHDALRHAPVWLKKGDTAVLNVQPSAPERGVYLCAIAITTASGEVIQASRWMLDELDKALDNDLQQLPHRLVQPGGDNQNMSGCGTITVPGTPPTTVGWWITVDQVALRAELIENGHDDVDDDWGTPGRTYLSDADTITDLISEISETNPEIISSRIGAQVAIDPLYNGDVREDAYRLLIDLPGGTVIAETSDDLAALVRHDIPDGDEHPGVTRMVGAITAAINDANRVLDDFFNRFQLR